MVSPVLCLAALLAAAGGALLADETERKKVDVWMGHVVSGRRHKGKTYRESLDNFKDMQYYSTVSLGSQAVKSLVDLSSIELIVFSIDCKWWCGGENKDYFRHKRSKTYMKGSLTAVIDGNNGALFGHDAYEEFSIGPFGSHVQPFWEITDADMPSLYDTHYEAILGLGPVPVHAQVLKRGAKKKDKGYAITLPRLHIRRYSICLDWRPGYPGYINWNEEILESHRDLFASTTLLESGFWFGRIQDVYLGTTKLGCEGGCGAVFDTTAPMLGLPPAAHDSLQRLVTAECEDFVSLPNLTFTLDGHKVTLPADSYFSQLDGSVSTSLLGHFMRGFAGNTSSSKVCQPSILKVNMSSPFGEAWILGLPFFRSYYTVFEQGDPPRAHFAPAPEACKLDDDSSAQDVAGYAGKMTHPRHMDMSNVVLPFWVRGAELVGHIPNRTYEEPLGARFGATSIKRIHKHFRHPARPREHRGRP